MRPADLLLAWVAAASLAAFGLTVLDKRRAVTRSIRIPERVLLGVALVGGTPGLALGMLVARHKTRKASFLARFTLVVLVQAAAAWTFLR